MRTTLSHLVAPKNERKSNGIQEMVTERRKQYSKCDCMYCLASTRTPTGTFHGREPSAGPCSHHLCLVCANDKHARLSSSLLGSLANLPKKSKESRGQAGRAAATGSRRRRKVTMQHRAEGCDNLTGFWMQADAGSGKVSNLVPPLPPPPLYGRWTALHQWQRPGVAVLLSKVLDYEYILPAPTSASTSLFGPAKWAAHTGNSRLGLDHQMPAGRTCGITRSAGSHRG